MFTHVFSLVFSHAVFTCAFIMFSKSVFHRYVNNWVKCCLDNYLNIYLIILTRICFHIFAAFCLQLFSFVRSTSLFQISLNCIFHRPVHIWFSLLFTCCNMCLTFLFFNVVFSLYVHICVHCFCSLVCLTCVLNVFVVTHVRIICVVKLST